MSSNPTRSARYQGNSFRTPPLPNMSLFPHTTTAQRFNSSTSTTSSSSSSSTSANFPINSPQQPPPQFPSPPATVTSAQRHATSGPSVHPQFRSKSVCKLFCQHCEHLVCNRGMKAILLGDTRVELYSTDSPPLYVQLVDKDYMTRNCQCRIRDVACLQCGNVIGYHVTQPCEICLDSCNNGHFWMFLADGVSSKERAFKGDLSKKLLWAQLPCADQDMEAEAPYENMCR